MATPAQPAVKTNQPAESGKGNSALASLVVLICLIAGVLIYVFILGNGSNFQGGDSNNEPVKDGVGHWFGLIHRGGVIVPILIGLILINISISIERWITIGKASGKYPASEFVRKIRSFLNLNNIDGALKECDVHQGSISNIVKSSLLKYKEMESNTSMDLEQKELSIQKEVEESTNLEMPMLEKNLVIIATLTSVSTLVALLGTVIGMIKAFSALGSAGGSVDAAALSSAISEALINTALGIGNAAVATILYNVFTTRIDKLTYAIDEAGYSIVQTFAAKHR
jgi:biopolymer transport protein ExbB